MEILKEHFEINKFDLESECLKQASLYQYYSEELANAKERRDKAENQLELIEAKAQLSFREQCAVSGAKVTEAIVNANVICNTEVIAKKDEIVQATKQVNILQVAVSSMEQKRAMIETIQRMQSSRSYNLEPVGGKDNSEYVESILNRQLNSKG